MLSIDSNLQEKLTILTGGVAARVSLTPYLLAEADYLKLIESCESFHSILEKCLNYYLNDNAFQLKFPELENVRALSCLIPPYKPWIQLARFDMVQDKHGVFKLLETNSDCPGGIVSTVSMKQVFLSLMPENQLPFNLDKVLAQPLDNEYCFVNHLRALLAQNTNSEKKPTIAYLYNEYRPLLMELEKLALLTKKSDMNAFYTTVQRLQYNQDNVYYKQQKIDLAYLKMDAFIKDNGQLHYCLYQHSPEEIKKLIAALEKQKIICVNSFPSIMVAENKRLLALLQSEPLFSHFSQAERDVVMDFCPRAFLLTDEPPLVKEVMERREHYVIKSPLDTQGRKVFVGRDCSAEDWQSCVTLALEQSYLVQVFVEQEKKLIHSVSEIPELIAMNTVVSAYLFGGKVVGLVARSSPNNVINVNRGGIVQNVFIIKD